MSSTLNTKSASSSIKLFAIPMLLKVINGIQFLSSKFTRSMNKDFDQLAAVPKSSSNHDQHRSIINLLNRGKNYDDAKLIAESAENWNLDLTRLDLSNVVVKGKSVWFNLED